MIFRITAKQGTVHDDVASLMNTPLANEPLIRLGVFACVFVGMVVWEALAPWRARKQSRTLRWSGNWGIFILDILLVRLAFPLGGVGIALYAASHGYGLFNQIAIAPWLAGIISFLALDLLIYGQHRLFHAIPLFWRLHRMHHADTELDSIIRIPVSSAGNYSVHADQG